MHLWTFIECLLLLNRKQFLFSLPIDIVTDYVLVHCTV